MSENKEKCKYHKIDLLCRILPTNHRCNGFENYCVYRDLADTQEQLQQAQKEVKDYKIIVSSQNSLYTAKLNQVKDLQSENARLREALESIDKNKII